MTENVKIPRDKDNNFIGELNESSGNDDTIAEEKDKDTQFE